MKIAMLHTVAIAAGSSDRHVVGVQRRNASVAAATAVTRTSAVASVLKLGRGTRMDERRIGATRAKAGLVNRWRNTCRRARAVRRSWLPPAQYMNRDERCVSADLVRGDHSAAAWWRAGRGQWSLASVRSRAAHPSPRLCRCLRLPSAGIAARCRVTGWGDGRVRQRRYVASTSHGPSDDGGAPFESAITLAAS